MEAVYRQATRVYFKNQEYVTMTKVIITVEDIDMDNGLINFGSEIIDDEDGSTAVVVAEAMAEAALNILQEMQEH